MQYQYAHPFPFQPVGAIFDIDETILDNGHETRGKGYHEQFRLQAAHEIGREQNLPGLAKLTYEDSLNAFRTAHEHTFAASLWNMLCMAGLRQDSTKVDESDALHKAITDRKNELYQQALKSEIQMIKDADRLIAAMNALTNGTLAIASAARRIDIDTFLQTNDIEKYFLPERIISLENVTNAKPHPQAFDLAFKSLNISNVDRAKTLAFEDAPKGVASAKQAGLFTVAITTQFSRDELSSGDYPADMVINRFTELL